MNQKVCKVISGSLLVLAVTVAALVILQSGDELLRKPIRLNWYFLLLSLGLAYGGLLLIVLPVWRHILSCYGIRKSFREDLRNYSYGALGTILPGSVWGIVGRSVFYAGNGISKFTTANAGILESLLIGIAATLVYALSSALQRNPGPWQRPEVVFVAAAFSFALLSPRGLNHILERLWRWTGHQDKPARVRFGMGHLMAWIGLEALGVVVGGLALYLLLLSFTGAPGDALPRIITAWAAAAVMGNLFFWLPGTFLLRDGFLVAILTPVLSLPTAILFALLSRLWSLVFILGSAAAIWLLDWSQKIARR
jgi:hypothetical protein